MTPNAPHAWRPQTPRSDFAERTVAAVLRDRAQRRRTTRPRWISVMAIAAILVAGGASAWTTLPRVGKVEVPPMVAPKATNQVQESQLQGRPYRASEPLPEAPRRPPAVPAPSPFRHKETPPVDGGRRANLPRCSCTQTICECVEVP